MPGAAHTPLSIHVVIVISSPLSISVHVVIGGELVPSCSCRGMESILGCSSASFQIHLFPLESLACRALQSSHILSPSTVTFLPSSVFSGMTNPPAESFSRRVSLWTLQVQTQPRQKNTSLLAMTARLEQRWFPNRYRTLQLPRLLDT